MSYLLETLGRGLLANLLPAFEPSFPLVEEDELDTLRQRATASPRSSDLAMRFGLVCLKSLRLTDARRAFETALEHEHSRRQAALGLACVYDEMGKLDDALRMLDIAAECDPRDPAIAFGMGFCCERKGDTAGAIAKYRRAIALCPQLRNAYERLAAIAVRQKDWDEAAACYEKLTEMDPDDLEARLLLANLYLQDGRPDDAVEQYQRALLVDPEANEGGVEAVDRMTAVDDFDGAIAAMEELVQRYPGMAVFHVHLGDLYAKTGRDEQALESYRAALLTQPHFLEATVKLGTQYLRKHQYVDAAQTFNRAIELNDRLMTAFVGLGVAQQRSGQVEEAQATLDLAASLEPSTTLLFAETARLQVRAESGSGANGNGEPKAADDGAGAPGPDDLLAETVRRHRQAVDENPSHADLQYRYGLLLRQIGEYEAAIVAFRNAIRINPHYSKALIKLGISLKEVGEVDEAIGCFHRALTLSDDFVDVHYQLGLLYAQRNQFDLAVEQFEQVLASQDVRPAFRENVALMLQNIGMVDRAAATWRSICELSPTADQQLSQRESALHRSEPG